MWLWSNLQHFTWNGCWLSSWFASRSLIWNTCLTKIYLQWGFTRNWTYILHRDSLSSNERSIEERCSYPTRIRDVLWSKRLLYVLRRREKRSLKFSKMGKRNYKRRWRCIRTTIIADKIFRWNWEVLSKRID